MVIRDLLIAIGFKVDDKAIDRVNKKVKRTRDQLTKLDATGGGGGGGRGIAGMLGGVAAGFVGIAAVTAGGRFLAGTISEFQQLRAQLVTIEQDELKAEKAFSRLQDFATTTPFQLANVVTAFARLRAVGLDPTNEDLRAMGDIAAGMGKDITEFADAVVAATTGEMERLKQFGIVAKQAGNKVTFLFKGQKTTIKKDAGEISKFLFDLGRTNFAGGMERQMDTIGGAFSNLQDNAAKFADQVGKAGLGKEMNLFIRDLTGAAGGADELAITLGRTLGFAVHLLRDLFRFAHENAQLLAIGLGIIGSAKVVSGLLSTVQAFKGWLTVMNPLTLKIALIVAGLLLVAGVVDDLVAFQTGRGSVIGDLLGDSDSVIEQVQAGLWTILGVLFIILAALNAPLALILAIGAAVLLLVLYWDQVKAAFQNFADQMPAAFENAFNEVKTFFVQLLAILLAEVYAFFDKMGTGIGEGAADLWFPIEDAWHNMIARLKAMWAGFTDDVKAGASGLLDAIPGMRLAMDTGESAGKFLGNLLGGGAADPGVDAARRISEVKNSNRSTAISIPGGITIPVTSSATDPRAVAVEVQDALGAFFDGMLRDAVADIEGAPE